MNLKNQVTLIGHLGRDPEFTKFDSGKMKTQFSLATSEIYRNQNGDRVESTEWHRCVAWGKLAETMNMYLKKGKEVALSGKLTHRSYTDKNGEKRYITEVVVSDFAFLGKKEKEPSEVEG